MGRGKKSLKMSDFNLRHLNAICHLTLKNCFQWTGGVSLFLFPFELNPISICHSYLF